MTRSEKDAALNDLVRDFRRLACGTALNSLETTYIGVKDIQCHAGRSYNGYCTTGTQRDIEK